MTIVTITLDVRTFRTPQPGHTPGRGAACLCDDCWREYLDWCDRQDGERRPAA
jgi:hypothetical protein